MSRCDIIVDGLVPMPAPVSAGLDVSESGSGSIMNPCVEARIQAATDKSGFVSGGNVLIGYIGAGRVSAHIVSQIKIDGQIRGDTVI